MAYFLTSTLYFPLLWLRLPLMLLLRIGSGLSFVGAVVLGLSCALARGSFPGFPATTGSFPVWPALLCAGGSFVLFGASYAYDWCLRRLNILRLHRRAY